MDLERMKSEVAVEIAALQDLLNSIFKIQKFRAAQTEAAVEPSTSVSPVRKKARRSLVRNPAVAPRSTPATLKSPLERIRSACATLPGPLTIADVAKTAGAEVKQVSNWFVNATARGELKRTGHGQYARTENFRDPEAGDRLLAEIHKEIDSQNGTNHE